MTDDEVVDVTMFRTTSFRTTSDEAVGLSENLPENLPENDSERKNLPENLPENDGERGSLPENLPEDLSETMTKLLGFIAAHPSATYDEMAAFLGRSRETVRVSVRKLKEDYKLLLRTGSARRGKWRVMANDGASARHFGGTH